jgi:hypothetical protein
MRLVSGILLSLLLPNEENNPRLEIIRRISPARAAAVILPDTAFEVKKSRLISRILCLER